MQETVDEVADATVRCFLRVVPAAVPGIAFLSGGQSGELASARLNAMHVRFRAPASRLPWALTFSFGRAIQRPALGIWRGQEARRVAAQQALLHRAGCNRAALRGEYPRRDGTHRRAHRTPREVIDEQEINEHQPIGGKAGGARHARRRAQARHGLLHRACPTRRCRRSAWPSAPRDIAGRRSTRRSTRGTSSPSPRRSACTARSTRSTARCFSAWTRTRSRCRRCASALEVLAANGVDVMIAERDEYTPTPVISHAILTYNRGRTTGLADGIVITPSHNPPHDGGFKYNPPNGGPGGDRRHRLDRGARRTSFSTAGLRGVKRIPLRAGAARRHDPSARLPRRLHRRPRPRDRHGRHPRRDDQPRRRSARRRRRPLLGADRRALRAEPHRRQRRRRSDLPLHDRGLGRPDPHGPVLALRDAAADRHEGSLRHRVRLRHRPRPARHRHPERRACCRPTTTCRSPSPTSSSTGRSGARTRRSARRW